MEDPSAAQCEVEGDLQCGIDVSQGINTKIKCPKKNGKMKKKTHKHEKDKINKRLERVCNRKRKPKNPGVMQSALTKEKGPVVWRHRGGKLDMEWTKQLV